jgi:hypothetical protein
LRPVKGGFDKSQGFGFFRPLAKQPGLPFGFPDKAGAARVWHPHAQKPHALALLHAVPLELVQAPRLSRLALCALHIFLLKSWVIIAQLFVDKGVFFKARRR